MSLLKNLRRVGSNLLAIFDDGSSMTFQSSSNSQLIQQNYIRNADFRFFQRQVPTTLTTVNYTGTTYPAYGPDGWRLLSSQNALSNTSSAQVSASGSGTIVRSQYAAQVRQASASSSQFGLVQYLEQADVISLQGKQVTFAVYIKANTNLNVRMGIVEWSGTADTLTANPVSSWAATPTLTANYAFDNTPTDFAVTTTYQLFSVTVTLGTSYNNLALMLWTSANQAQNTDIFILQPQLVIGSTPVDFAKIQKPVTYDMMIAQRYFEKNVALTHAPLDTSENPGTVLGGLTNTYSANKVTGFVTFKVEKRAFPTILAWNSAGSNQWTYILLTAFGTTSTGNGAFTNFANSPNTYGFVPSISVSATSDPAVIYGYWLADCDL
jgi:hypothetical protein